MHRHRSIKVKIFPRIVSKSIIISYSTASSAGATLKAPKETPSSDSSNERNHRLIGKKQGLFTFHPHSPGSPFFLPHGTRILSALKTYLRSQYQTFGFQEVVTPLLFNKKLWETSGHWENYKDDMFVVQDQHDTISSQQHLAQLKRDQGQHVEGCAEIEINGLKPMNCPGHCLLFADTAKSYRDLPLRYAEFSPLHRNEASGALTGLTRVRKFHQDDGHIFCTRDQLGTEMAACLKFLDIVYTKLGFTEYEMTLSTRPETNYIGSLEDWAAAELALTQALEASGRPFSVSKGDGAFYGPKIDIQIKDSTSKLHQTATIQLDFQLSTRFDLSFTNSNNTPEHPVIIHRAILGSLERTMAILLEFHGGKWPFWISPRHVYIASVRPDLHPHAVRLASRLQEHLRASNAGAGFTYYIDVQVAGAGHDATLAKQVREAQMLGYNYIVVVGDREVESGMVAVRERDDDDRLAGLARNESVGRGNRKGKKMQMMKVEEFVSLLHAQALSSTSM